MDCKVSLTLQDLTGKISSIKRKAHELTSERANLNLSSLRGDQAAQQRISEIDVERRWLYTIK